MRVVVAGASGFVGRRLCPSLESRGHEVTALTRDPDGYAGAGRPAHADVHRPQTLPPALDGCDAAVYLVHSLGSQDFEQLDARAARAFGLAASDAGVRRIAYLGGLGPESEGLSAHLRSRREVEGLLGSGGVPVTVLRAGIIIGAGGASWDLMSQLVDRLPVMVTPRWVTTRCQPIAVADVVDYLVRALETDEASGKTFEIGGPDVLTYVAMLRRIADLKARRRPAVLSVPVLSPRLSSLWLSLVSDVDYGTGRALVDSMVNEVVVRDDSIRALLPGDLIDFDDAALAAVGDAATEG